MENKERILLALRAELEPLGYRYFKSTGKFSRKVDKNTIISIVYIPECFRHGFTDVILLARGEYRDIEEVLYKLTNVSVATTRRHFGISCQLFSILQMDLHEYNADFCFWDGDSEDEYNRKLNKILERIKTHLLPYVEALSYKDSALEKAIDLEKRSLLFYEYVIPIMYCVWKHDKKAALDYLEERRQQKLSWIKPEEWERMERMKKGEKFMQDERPINALAYERYIEGAKKVREWIESQEYDD